MTWSGTSDQDGQLGTGPSVSAFLTEGTHRITASVADSDGIPATDEISLDVTLAPPGTVTFDAVEDTYVDADESGTRYGDEAILRVDKSPTRETYLRFDVGGVRPFAVEQAILRLTVGPESSHGSSSGGRVEALTDSGWSEATTKYSNRPDTDGPALATAGAVSSGDVVEFDVTPALFADGTYDFAIVTTSKDAVGYNSREAVTGRPQLILSLTENTAPTVSIDAPTSGATVVTGNSTTLAATALDAEDGEREQRRDVALGSGRLPWERATASPSPLSPPAITRSRRRSPIRAAWGTTPPWHSWWKRRPWSPSAPRHPTPSSLPTRASPSPLPPSTRGMVT